MKPSLIEENRKESALGNGNSLNKDYLAHLSKLEKKRKKMEDIKKKYTCNKPVYEGCKMLDPDGVLLSHIDQKKAKWYVEKGLATVVSKDDKDTTI